MQPEEDKTVKLARALVRIPSVTPVDSKDLPKSIACLAVTAAAAEKSGAKVTNLGFKGGHHKWDYPVENIYAEWTFGTPEKHICFIGHVDVVPPGDAAQWRGNPYSGEVRDGMVYGRGITDMKGSIAAFLTAMEEIAADLKDVRISMILTADEEWAAVNGTDKVLKWMKEQGKEPDAFIVGEPTAPDVLGSQIKIGRRGSLSGTFNVAGVQGHAAYQDLFENPNRALALAISILTSHEWKDGNEHFPSTNFEPVSVRSGDMTQTAIIPGKAELLWNIRYTHQQTPDSLEQWIHDMLANPPEWAKSHPDAGKLGQITVKANKDTASIPYYSEPGFLADTAKSAVKDTVNVEAKLEGSGGTTDGRFAKKEFPKAEIIELGLPEHGGHAHHNDNCGGMHQVDECAAISDLVNLRKIFGETVKRYASQQPPKKTAARKPDPAA